MGFFSRLLGLGVAAGATYAAVKVAQKYEDNKAADAETGAAEGAEGGSDVLGDLGKAATEVYNETAAKVKEAAENAGVDTEKVTSTIKEAGKAVGEAGKVVVGKVKDAAGDYYDAAKDKAGEVYGQAKDKATEVYTKAKDAVNDAFGVGEAQGEGCACGAADAESCTCETKPEEAPKE